MTSTLQTAMVQDADSDVAAPQPVLAAPQPVLAARQPVVAAPQLVRPHLMLSLSVPTH
jgi:hypothetical protein